MHRRSTDTPVMEEGMNSTCSGMRRSRFMSSTQSTFDFMMFPLELRQQIYRYLLIKTKYISLILSVPLKISLSQYCRPLSISGMILLVSKQICDEASPVLYGENEFALCPKDRCWIGSKNAWDALFSLPGRRACSYFRDVEVKLGLAEPSYRPGHSQPMPKTLKHIRHFAVDVVCLPKASAWRLEHICNSVSSFTFGKSSRSRTLSIWIDVTEANACVSRD